MFSVIIPFRNNLKEPSRLNSLFFVKGFWETNFDCEVIISDSTYSKFNRSEARNIGVAKANYETLVFSDADTFCDIQNIPEALNFIKKDRWVLPYKRYYRLSKEFSKNIINNNILHISKPDYELKFINNSWSGVVCLNKKMFYSVNGYNENYVGWGFEDYEFKDSLISKFGEPIRVNGSSYHLWHEVEPFTTKDSSYYLQNKDLYERKNS